MDLTPGPAEDQERSDGFRRWIPELEPRIWSHITDALPDGHPLAQGVVACVTCNDMVHASNNECMSTWVETGRGAYCIACFVDAIKEVQPAREKILPNGRTITFSEQTFHLLEEGEGWGLTSNPMREAAYRAGREDAAKEVPERVAVAAERLRRDIREAIDVCYGELGGEADTSEDVAGVERAIAHDMARVLDWIAAAAPGTANTERGSEG